MTRSQNNPFQWLRAMFLMLLLLAGTGCQRVLFGFLNRGLPPPEATVLFAPDRGLSLDIYRPQSATAGAAPVVVFFYGGSWQQGKRGQYRFVGRRLAANGILTIVADYRTWPQAGFPAFMDDAAQAVAWARDNATSRGGDPERLFLAGHSAGAHIAALLATDPRYLQRHDVAPTELAGVIGLSGPYDFVIDGDLEKVFGDRSQWPQAQPVNFVGGNEPPFLLVHGVKDDVVESRDSVELAAKLRANGVDARLLLLPGRTHGAPLGGLYDPARVPCLLPAMLAFVRGDPPPPSGECVTASARP